MRCCSLLSQVQSSDVAMLHIQVIKHLPIRKDFSVSKMVTNGFCRNALIISSLISMESYYFILGNNGKVLPTVDGDTMGLIYIRIGKAKQCSLPTLTDPASLFNS